MGYIDKITVGGTSYDIQDSNLKTDFGDVTESTRNMFDPWALVNVAGWQESDGDFYGTIGSAYSKFKQSSPYPGLTFAQNTVYTFTCLAKTNGNAGTTGTGMYIGFVYTDNSYTRSSLPNNTSTYTRLTVTSDSNKTVAGLYFVYGASADNVWHMKEMQLNAGAYIADYMPYISAADYVVRETVPSIEKNVDMIENAMVTSATKSGMWTDGGLSASVGSTTTESNRIRTDFLPDSIVKVTPASGYEVQILAYNRTNSAFVGVWSGVGYQKSVYFFNSAVDLIAVLKDYKVKVVGRLSNNASISASTAANNFTFTSIQTLNEVKDVMFVDDTAILARDGLTAAVAYPQCYIPVVFDVTNAGVQDIRSNLITLTDTKASITFKNTSEATVRLMIVTSSSDGTDTSSDTVEDVSSGASHTFSSLTRKYLKIRLIKSGSSFTADEIKSLSLCSYVLDTELQSDLFSSKLTLEEYDTIADRLEGDEVFLSDFVHQYDIPSYFDDNIAAAITAVRSNTWSVGIHGTNFVWITDTHWEDNEKHSPNLIRKIIKQTNIKEVLCGGDIIDYGSRSDMIPVCYAHMQAFDFVEGGLKLTFGNHDANQNNNTPESGNIFTKDEVYAIEYLPLEKVAHFGDYFDYYFDVPATKTRYIALTTFWNASGQSTWLTNLLANSTDWNIVVFTHAIWVQNETDIPSSTQALLTILDTNNSTNHNVKAIMTGHLHLDKIGYTAGGIPIIGTDTDNRANLNQNNPNTATVGTITEQAFDVVSVDYTGDVIYCVRVGRGKSRKINTDAVSVSTTETLTTDLTSPSWSSSDSSVATVSNGTVSAVAAGSAVIAADGTDGQEFWNIVVT